MPYSENVFDKKVSEILMKISPNVLHDIGAGAGKYGKLIGAIGIPTRKIAIEIDPEYIERFGLKDLYDEVWNIPAIDLINPKYFDIDFDMVIIGDCIEHLRKSDGIDLLNFLVYRTRYVIIQYPVEYVQNSYEGKFQEAHISVWSEDDFKNFNIAEKAEIDKQRLVLIKGYLQ